MTSATFTPDDSDGPGDLPTPDVDDATALLACERRVVAHRKAYQRGIPGAARALADATMERERIRSALHLDLIR